MKHATETEQSGTWLGATLKITAVTVIKMLSDKRLTVQLGSLCAEGQHGWKQLPGSRQWADASSYLGDLRLEELPADERKRAGEREKHGWTESAPLSDACSSNT